MSKRYGFAIGHPADWKVMPSDHDWTLGVDQWGSTGEERFLSPPGDILVSAWSVPSETPAESLAGIQAWAEQYCQESGNTACATIGDRAIPLCRERWDCHPGVLVPFETDVQAFFTGSGAQEQMVVVAVWRPENWGSRQLLEAFLSTMDVCPAKPEQIPSGCARDIPRAGAATGDQLVTSG